MRVNADRIRTARTDSGLSLRALAAKAECSQSAIHHIETGANRPSLTILRRIAHATGHPVEHFIEEEALSMQFIGLARKVHALSADSQDGPTKAALGMVESMLSHAALIVAGAGQ
jgi:transcriptional regulator with XRE-family HTH domain